MLESTHRMGILNSLLGAVGLASSGQTRTLMKRADAADQRIKPRSQVLLRATRYGGQVGIVHLRRIISEA